MSVKILIVIPCYNEEEALPLLLKDLKEKTATSFYSITPLVINDCSKDKTAAVARREGIRVLDLVNNLGIGGAVQAGLKYARDNDFDYAIQMDGDGQHPPSELDKLIGAAVDSGADVVIGSRFLTRQGFQSSRIRRLGIRYFFGVNKLFTGNRIYDSTSGFRVLGKKAINLAVEYYPDDYPEPESLVIYSKTGLKIKEVPVVMKERLGGQSSISSSSSVYYFIKVSLSMFYSYIRKS